MGLRIDDPELLNQSSLEKKEGGEKRLGSLEALVIDRMHFLARVTMFILPRGCCRSSFLFSLSLSSLQIGQAKLRRKIDDFGGMVCVVQSTATARLGKPLSLYIFQLLVAIGFDLPSRIRDESNVYALLTLRF